MTWTADQLQLGREILAIARKYSDVSELSHLAVVIQESDGLNRWAVNAQDPGGSYGPHQINGSAHPDITPAVAEDPYYDYAYPEIRERWQTAWAASGGWASWSDVAARGDFLESFAPAAQGSIAWYAGLGAIRYAQALEVLELVS